MYDFQNPDDVERARIEAVAAVDPSLVCEFVERCELEGLDPSFVLDEFLTGWIAANESQIRAIYGTTYAEDVDAPVQKVHR